MRPDRRRNHVPLTGPEVQLVKGNRLRCIPTAPPQQARPPGNVYVFLMGKKAFIKILAVDSNIFKHLTTIEGSSPIYTKDLPRRFVLSLVFFPISAHILLPEAVDEQTCRINDTWFLQQFACRRSTRRMLFEDVYQRGDIVRLHNDIRV